MHTTHTLSNQVITEEGDGASCKVAFTKSSTGTDSHTLKKGKGSEKKMIFFPLFCCAEANYAYVVFPQKNVEKCVAACRRINKNVEASFLQKAKKT